LFALLVVLAAGVAAAAAPFDASRLQTGRFAYRVMREGKPIATFTLTVRAQADGTYAFSGDAVGFEQHWESVARADFTPVSARLAIGRDHGEKYGLTVNYTDGRARGTITRTDVAPRQTEQAVPANTVDQRIDWAAMLSTRLADGEEVAFHVYDPDTGATPVLGRGHGTATITVPAGTFTAARLDYRMDKPDGPETYEIDVTPDAPRLMLRETFPDGSITELVEAVRE
jgi:hypothetical protein